MIEEEEESSICATCGHAHEQGVKCSICGHVGKSQIFSKMRARSNEKRGYRVELYRCGTPIEPTKESLQFKFPSGSTVDNLTFLEDVYPSSFLDEELYLEFSHSIGHNLIDYFKSFTEDILKLNILDSSYNFLLLFGGDNLIGSVRCKFLDQRCPSFLSQPNILEIDMLFINPIYRNQKQSWRLLLIAISQIQLFKVQCNEIRFLVPNELPWITLRLLAAGFVAMQDFSSFPPNFSILSLSLEHGYQELINYILQRL